MVVARLFSAAAASIAMLLLTATALAQQPSDGGDEAEAPGRGRPVPRDDRAGNINGFAGAVVAVPAGDLGGGLTFGQVANAGVGGELGLGVGITRYSGLELRGQFVQLGASFDCPSCRTQMFAGGLGLVYHATQALGFDPWVRYSAGYRALVVSGPLTTLSATAPPEGTFHGVDVASITLGGDFFPVRWFGIGLFFQGDVGVIASAPSAEARGAVYGLFQAGLRIALEPQRKAPTAASDTPRTRTAVAEHSDFGPALYNRGAR